MSMVEKVKAVLKMWKLLDHEIKRAGLYDNEYVGTAIPKELDFAIYTAESAAVEQDAAFQRAREAWRIYTDGTAREWHTTGEPILDEFFGGGEAGTVNLDTNRVCRKCLHQYNDRVEHVCGGEGEG